MLSARHEPGDVRHVGEEERAAGVGDGAHALEINGARVSGGAHGDHPGLRLMGLLLKRVVIDDLRVLAHAVVRDLVELAREVRPVPVGQVAAVREIHRQDPVAGLQHGEIHRHVGLRAGVGLHVDVLRAGEELAGAVEGELLHHVHVLAAAIPAAAGITLGVFVREDAALRLAHGGRSEVFRGDQLKVLVLAARLLFNGAEDVGIDVGKGRSVGLLGHGKQVGTEGCADARGRRAPLGEGKQAGQGLLHRVARLRVNRAGKADGIRHVEVVLVGGGIELAQQEDLRRGIGEEVSQRLSVRGGHGHDHVGLAHERGRDRLGTVRHGVDAVLAQHVQSVGGGALARRGRHSGREGGELGPTAREVAPHGLRHRAAADVAGADEEELFHGNRIREGGRTAGGEATGAARAVNAARRHSCFCPLMKLLLPLLLLAVFAGSARADRLLESYTARLSSQDHFSSAGARLTSAAAVIRQDRANFHKFGRQDPEDEGDQYFAAARNREVLEAMLERGSSTRGALNSIVNGTPLVQVSVFRAESGGRDYVTVTVK